MRYQVEHLKKISLTLCAHVLFSIYFMLGNMAAFDMSLSEAVVSPGKKNLDNFECFIFLLIAYGILLQIYIKNIKNILIK